MTGWNMPPGCNPSDIPGWEDPPCAVCGQLDDCVCPECPICGAQGDPACYAPMRVRTRFRDPELQAQYELAFRTHLSLLEASLDYCNGYGFGRVSRATPLHINDPAYPQWLAGLDRARDERAGVRAHGLIRSFAQVALLAETERQREEEAAVMNAYDSELSDKLDREALWADATHEPGPEPEEFNP